jgi:hypothetical protein
MVAEGGRGDVSLLRARKASPGWIDPRRGGAGGPAGAGGTIGAGDWATAGPVGGDSRLRATLSRGLAMVLWLAIGLSLLLGLLNVPRGTAPAAPPAADPGAAQPQAPPSGCAELLVAGWISGDARLAPGGLAAGRQPDVEREAVRTYTAGSWPGENAGSWAYLVAAQVRERPAAEEPFHDLGLQFFRVTMVESGGGCQGWAPAALPMQVPAPDLAATAPSRYPVPLASSGTDLSRTLEAFFAGMLTGAGDIERYLAPGATVAPIVPPPYAEVTLSELRGWAGTPRDGVPPDGTVVRVLATVTVDRAALPLDYPVTVSVRGGRWEVLAVDPLVGTGWLPAPDPDPRRRS